MVCSKIPAYRIHSASALKQSVHKPNHPGEARILRNGTRKSFDPRQSEASLLSDGYMTYT
jgi:hypothetical protein